MAWPPYISFLKHTVCLFQYVISNTFIFYFRKDSSIWSIPLLWVCFFRDFYYSCIVFSLPIFNIYPFLLTFVLFFFIYFWIKNFSSFYLPYFKGFTYIYLLLLFSYSNLYLRKKILPFICILPCLLSHHFWVSLILTYAISPILYYFPNMF